MLLHIFYSLLLSRTIPFHPQNCPLLYALYYVILQLHFSVFAWIFYDMIFSPDCHMSHHFTSPSPVPSTPYSLPHLPLYSSDASTLHRMLLISFIFTSVHSFLVTMLSSMYLSQTHISIPCNFRHCFTLSPLSVISYCHYILLYHSSLFLLICFLVAV